MPTYNAAFSGLGLFYDGLGLLALNVSSTPTIVQTATAFTSGGVSGSAGPLSITFGSPVAAGHTIVVAIMAHSPPGNFLPDAYSISDTIGHSYSLIQTQQSGLGGEFNQNLQYIAANTGSGSDAITLSWTHAAGPTNAVIAVLAIEIDGLDIFSPVADHSQAWVSGSSAHTISVNALEPLMLIALENDDHKASVNATTVAGYSLAAFSTNDAGGACIKAFVLGLNIACGSPPGGILGSPYAHLFPASGGTQPYVYAITSGSLPPGLTLDILAGTVTGIPTATGIYPFTVSVTDSGAHTASANCSITIAAGGAWIIQEITAEFIPQDPNRPADPNLPGLYRYTVRCVNSAQAGTYLGFWGAFGGSGGGSVSSSGGGQPPGAPAAPPVGTLEVQTNGVDNASQALLNLRSSGSVTVSNPSGGNVDIAGPVLETNGTPNATQSLLNLKAGTNITLTPSGGDVTIAATGGGTPSPLTTKGDVWGYSSTDARIPIGTNGQVLTADSAQALGLKWAPAASAIGGVNLQTSNYTIVSGDNGKLVSFSNTSALTATLPSSAPASPWFIAIEDTNNGLLTINPNGLLIDGSAASLVIRRDQGLLIFSDGSNYYTERGIGRNLSSFPYTVGIGILGTPSGGSVCLAAYTYTEAAQFDENFNGSVGTCGTNPNAGITWTVKKNGSSIGTIAISTIGAFTFSSTAGAPQSFAAGDRIEITGSSSADATLSDVAISLAAIRVSNSGTPFVVPAMCAGIPLANQTVALFTFPIPVIFSANFAGSYATVGANPTTGALSWTVKKNGSSIGTVAFSTGGAATFTTSGAVTYNPGDIMQVYAPGTTDATMADIAISFAGTR